MSRWHLAEVKFRTGSVRRGYQRIRISSWELARYQKDWPEAVLIVVSPFRDGFHAQYVSELSARGESKRTTDSAMMHSNLWTRSSNNLPAVISRVSRKESRTSVRSGRPTPN